MIEVDGPVGLRWVFGAGKRGEGFGVQGRPVGAEGGEGGRFDSHGRLMLEAVGVSRVELLWIIGCLCDYRVLSRGDEIQE